MPAKSRRRLGATVLLALALAACGSDATSPSAGDAPGASPSGASPSSAQSGQRFPDVVDVAVTGEAGTYNFAVTISSPYDSPERYADGWRVTGPDGTVYGVHQLLHSHEGEQPFTRSQTGVTIPEGVAEVIVQARDTANGYGGKTATVSLPDRGGSG